MAESSGTSATVIQLPSPHVSAVRLTELFHAIDGTWFHPHDMGPAGAATVAGHSGRDIYLVLEAHGELVAYGMLRGWDAGFEVPSLGIGVRTARRRSGYARALMEALHDAARRNGAREVRLRVSERNQAALTLYESMGYAHAGTERGERVMILALATS